MIKNLLSIFLLFLVATTAVHAQKIKVKKGLITVDGIEYLKTNKDYGNEIISNLEDKNLIKVEWHSFDVPNPAYNNMNDPKRTSYPKTTKKWYAVATFMDENITFETDLPAKRIYEALYKDGVIEEQGTVNKEKAEALAKKIHKNVSGDRQNVLIVY